MELKIGDTFRNSVNKLVTVKNIYNYGRRVELFCPDWTSTYHHNAVDVINKIESGHYKDYKSVSNNKNYEVGGTFITDFGNTYKIIDIDNLEINAFCINGSNKNDYKNWSYPSIRSFPYTPPTSNDPDMSRTWKKEDFLNTKIEVDNPEKSKRFQEFLSQFGLQFNGGPDYFDRPFLFIEKTGTLMHGQLLSTFKGEKNREIKYSEIFSNNNQSITTTNENNSKNTNDLSSTHFTGNRREETATAIAFSKTSRIASSSRYIGNTVKGRSTPTRIGRSEISFQAVTA